MLTSTFDFDILGGLLRRWLWCHVDSPTLFHGLYF